MKKSQLIILAVIFVLSAVMRLLSLPGHAFFCDNPGSVLAVETGKMVIQFPGYAPYHWMILAFGWLVGGTFQGSVLFAFLCGMASLWYVIRFGNDCGGFRVAALVSTLMGFSPIAIYFSCSGASYCTDLLGMSAMLFHGNRVIINRSSADLRYAVLWFVFGCLMRTLSFPFLTLGLLYLLWKAPTRGNIIFTTVALTASVIFFAVITFHYYGSLEALKGSTEAPKGAGLHGVTASWMIGNEVRNIMFLLWALNAFVLVILYAFWAARQRLTSAPAVFLILLALPYFAFLVWYDCHAGYVCLLLPAAICAPWLLGKTAWIEARAGLIAGVFIPLSLLQFFVAKPIPFRGSASLILNTYAFTYTREGMKEGMFDNLKDWAYKYHLDPIRPKSEEIGAVPN